MNLEAKETLEKYRTQSLHYLKNAFSLLQAGDAEKASEFLWGSMAEALKAVAASRGKILKRHWDIGDYAEALAKELGDRAIFDAFDKASHLHSNFYEAGLRLRDVYLPAEQIKAAVIKLLCLTPDEA